jgi:hypothetical protein
MPDRNAIFDGSGSNQAVGRRPHCLALGSAKSVDLGGRHKQVQWQRVTQKQKRKQHLTKCFGARGAAQPLDYFRGDRATDRRIEQRSSELRAPMFDVEQVNRQRTPTTLSPVSVASLRVASLAYPCRFESDGLADSALQLRLPAARIVPLRNG